MNQEESLNEGGEVNNHIEEVEEENEVERCCTPRIIVLGVGIFIVNLGAW
jgi:hypothetical protein